MREAALTSEPPPEVHQVLPELALLVLVARVHVRPNEVTKCPWGASQHQDIHVQWPFSASRSRLPVSRDTSTSMCVVLGLRGPLPASLPHATLGHPVRRTWTSMSNGILTLRVRIQPSTRQMKRGPRRPLFICLAEREGFEPSWGKAPNGFRVRAVMATSVPLHLQKYQ